MILIGADGGPLGGPVRALEGGVKALETADRLGRLDRAESRQDKLDIQREADAKSLMKMREESLKLDQSQEARQVAEQDWQMKRRQIEQDQDVSARQSSAAILRGLTGDDVYDPNVGPVRPGYTVDAKSPFPPATQRAMSELQQRASTMDPQEVRAQLQTILQAGKVGIETQSRARIKSLLKNLSTPSVNADGQEMPGAFDEQQAAQYEEMIDGDPNQGIPPASGADLDRIESGILGVVRENAKSQAVRNMTAQSVARLRTFQQNLEGMRQQLGPMAEGAIDPEAEAEFDAQVSMLEQIGPNLTPSAIASMEKAAMSSLRRGASSTSSKSKEKPRSQWDEHDWYDRDAQNAKTLGFDGADAEAYIARQKAARRSSVKEPPPSDAERAKMVEFGRKVADPGYQGAGAPQATAKPASPWSKEGTPESRVQSAVQVIAQSRMGGDMWTEEEIKAALDAAEAGEPMPERKTDRRGKPLTRGEAIGKIKGGQRKDTNDEAARMNRMLDQ